MRLADILEEMNLDRDLISHAMIYEIAKHYGQNQWVDVTKIFLRGVARNHVIPGKVLLTMAGICDHYREHTEITNRQQLYLVFNLMQYWDQMSCEMRGALML